MNVTFDYAEDVAQGVKTFWFRPERPVRYIAGQFTELYLPHKGSDERGIRRWFTLSSSPTEELVGITTGFAEENGSSFKRQLLKLKPGDQLKLADPMGDFVLPKNPSIPILFVAAGLGITPVRSMVKWLLDTGEKRDITLLYSVPTPAQLAFHDLFTEAGIDFRPHFSSQNGRLTPQEALQAVPAPEAQIYLSGPEALVEHFYKDLQKRGVPSEQINGDYFPGYTAG